MPVDDARLVKPLGTVLDGKLRLDRLLGAGGMGAVYLATHLVLGQRVAVKVLGAAERRSPESLARFVQEAQVASRISSEHVVRVFDLGHADSGEPYIVMELLEGEDLASILEREARLAIPAAVGLVLQSCVGVAAAHAAGLVHRDLKPANLYAVRRSAGGVLVKVLDFGLSKIVGPGAPQLTQSSSCFGTPLYMSPEQILSAKHVDARCDQHALAMILFELLTGDPPFYDEAAGAITVKIATAPPPSARARRPEIPAALDAALQRAMAKRPGDRFADLADLADALAPFADPAERALAGAVRDALARGAWGPDASSPGDDPSTLPIARRDDTHGGLATSSIAARRARGRRGAIGVGVAALALAGGAVWLALPPAPPTPSSAVAAADPPGSAAAPAAVEVATVEPAPSASAQPSASASSSASASAPRPSARAPRPPTTSPRRRPSPPRASSTSADPTEVFGARRR